MQEMDGILDKLEVGSSVRVRDQHILVMLIVDVLLRPLERCRNISQTFYSWLLEGAVGSVFFFARIGMTESGKEEKKIPTYSQEK